MSLLMDALKKAEQAKRAQVQEGEPPPSETPGGLSLEPLEPQPAPDAQAKATIPGPAEAPLPGRTSLPELPSQLEVLDEEFLAHVEQRPAPVRPHTPEPAKKASPTPPRPRAEPTLSPQGTTGAAKPAQAAQTATPPREEAKNVFAAKQTASGGNKKFAIVVGVSTLAAVAGIGVYFWQQLQPAGGLKALPQANVPAPRPVPPPPANPTPSATAGSAAPPAVASTTAVAAPSSVSPLPAASSPNTATTGAQAIPSGPGAARESTFAPRGSEATARAPETARTPTQRPVPEADSPIRITAGKLRSNPSLTRGFDALNTDDLSTAEAEYTKVLKSEPKNPDALHGMAAIALRQGQHAQAESYYLRALEADPRDPVAQAGIVGLKGQVDPLASISRLKTLLAAQPDQPFLHFALGNVYAGSERWHEAQQSFFKAWTGDPDNPDYLFNLAVSLDHLHQPKLAVQYYAQALAAAANRPAGFDKTQVAARLRDLQR